MKLIFEALGFPAATPAGSDLKIPIHPTLVVAMERGDVDDVKRHVLVGADVGLTGSNGWTALMLAAYLGDVELARLLLEYGAEADPCTPTGATPLLIAVHNGHLDVADFLLDQGADPDARTLDGRTALLLAVHGGNPQIIACLLAKGADVHVQDGTGHSVLTEVERLERRRGFKRPDIREMLAAYGARGLEWADPMPRR